MDKECECDCSYQLYVYEKLWDGCHSNHMSLTNLYIALKRHLRDSMGEDEFNKMMKVVIKKSQDEPVFRYKK